MCGRFTLKENKKVKKNFNIDIKPSYNISPFTNVLVLDEKANPSLMRWLFNPSWSKTPMNLINARSETLQEKPSFKNVKRCVFIADGWYEWQTIQKSKKPFYHHFNNELIYFGGIYNLTSGCAIVTKQAHDNLKHIHHRQPVLLEEKELPQWIKGDNLLTSNITNKIKFYSVDTKVNNPNNNHHSNIDIYDS